MTTRFLKIAGLEIAVHESDGHEEPTLFCLHGNSQDASVFALQMKGEIGQRFRMVCMDLPGHGASSRATSPAGTCSLSGHVAMVKEVAGRLDAGNILLVGHSLGGHILIQASASLPNLVGLLVYGTPPLKKPWNLHEAFLPHATTSFIFQEHLSAAEEQSWAEAQFFHSVPTLASHIREIIHLTDPHCRSSLLSGTVGDLQDEWLLLQHLPVPCALLLGDHDLFVNQDYCRSLSWPGLWRGTVQIIEDSGHSPQLEVPERFNRLLRDFIQHCQ